MRTRLLLILLMILAGAQSTLAIPPWDAGAMMKAAENANWSKSESVLRKLRSQKLPSQQQSQVDYNLGLSLYNQEKYEEALPFFQSAAKVQDNNALKAKALYNQGNSYFKLEKLDEAKKSYQQALLSNPEDDDARHNIEVVLEKQKQQQNKNNKDQQQKQDQNQDKDQDKNKDQNKKKNQDDKKDQQGDQDKKKPQEKDEKQKNGQPQMTEAEKKKAREAAERQRLLEYFRQQEKDGRPPVRVRAQAPPVEGKTW